MFLGEIHGESIDCSQQWRADINVNGKQINFKLDSGADVSVIPEGTYKKLASSVTLQKAYNKLYGPCKMQLNCTGKFLAVLQHNEQSCPEEIYLVAGLEQSLLGRNACDKLGIISQVSAVESSNSRNTYEEKFP